MFTFSSCLFLETVNSSPFLSPTNSPDLSGPSSQLSVPPAGRPPPNSNRIARCSWILTRLFPDVSQIFLHTLLETRDFDLLETLETLVNMAQQSNFLPYTRIIPSIRFYSGTLSKDTCPLPILDGKVIY